MKNPRITPKERGLLKGAIRRVFSRSELRRKVLEASVIKGYSDPDRPRVKKWSRCHTCGNPTPTYKTQIDHVDPVIPVNSSFEEMGLDLTADRTWCEENNLKPICISCHTVKSKAESKVRRENKKKKVL